MTGMSRGAVRALLTGITMVLVGVMLSGCVGLYVDAVKPGYVFNEKDDWGLVIIGYGPVAKPPETISQLGLNFSRYDVATQQLTPAPAKEVPLVLAVQRNFSMENHDRHEKIGYMVTRVPPGDYALAKILVNRRDRGALGTTEVTGTYGDQEKPANINVFATKEQLSIAGRRIPRFTVRAGEVLYVGDYRFDISGFPAKIAPVTFDPAGAETELVRWRRGITITGEMKTATVRLLD